MADGRGLVGTVAWGMVSLGIICLENCLAGLSSFRGNCPAENSLL